MWFMIIKPNWDKFKAKFNDKPLFPVGLNFTFLFERCFLLMITVEYKNMLPIFVVFKDFFGEVTYFCCYDLLYFL